MLHKPTDFERGPICVDGSPLEEAEFERRVPLPEEGLWLKQGLNRRPQLIDQRFAVANLPSFLDRVEHSTVPAAAFR